MVELLWKTVWRFLKNLNIEIPCDPAVPLMDTYPVKKKTLFQGFPGGPVVEKPPASAGDMGLIPGPGRSHMLWGN